MAAVAEALKAREARRTAHTARRPWPGSLARRSPARRCGAPWPNGWRTLLRRNVAEARPVLEALLASRVVVTPRRGSLAESAGDEDVAAFDVRIPLTTCGILEGLSVPNGVASPSGAASHVVCWLRRAA